MSIDKYNAEGYYAPVTYEALTKIEKEERVVRKAASRPLKNWLFFKKKCFKKYSQKMLGYNT